MLRGQKIFLDFTYDITINTAGNLEKHACNPEMNHNYDKTLYNMVAHKNEKELNCSVPFHPITLSKLSGKIIDVCNNSETGKKALRNLHSLADEGPDLPNKNPCAGMDFFLGVPEIEKNTIGDQATQEAFIRLYIKSEVKVKSVIIYYDFTALTADIGGYMGMFLGISLVDLTMKCNTAFLKLLEMKLTQIYGG